MSSRIRGITIELNGDATQLEDALKSVNKRSNDLAKELKDVDRLLKFNPGNVELLAQRQQLLTDRIAATSEKLEGLRAAQAQVEAQFQSGDIGVEQYRAFQRELVTTEGSLNGLRNQLQRMTDEQQRVADSTRELSTFFRATGTSVDQFADTLGSNLTNAIRNGTASSEQLEQALTQVGRQALGAEADLDRMRTTLRTIDSGGSIDEIRQDLGRIEQDARGAERAVGGIGDALKDVGQSAGLAAAGVGAAVVGLVGGMEEYNRSMARLRTNATMAGRDLGLVEEAFKQVTAVTGETDSAVETVSNLLASGFSDNQLAAMIDQINGAAIKFSDTLKTEGIADGIQETFATGEAIGSFAELLERSGVDLETFNAKLQEAQKTGEGTQFVMQQMADLGFGSVLEKYKELNPEITANAEAQANLQKQLGELATALTPLVTQITEFGIKMATWVNENQTLATTFVIVSTAIGVIIGVLSALAPIIQLVIANWAAVKLALVGLTGPIGIAVAAFATIAVALTTAYMKSEWFRDQVSLAWDVIQKKTSEAFSKVKEFISTYIEQAVEFGEKLLAKFRTFWDKNAKDILEIARLNFEGIKNTIQTVMKFIQGVFEAVLPIITNAVKIAFNLIKLTIDNATTLILGIIQFFLKVFKGDWEGAFETIKEVATNIMENIYQTFRDIDLLQVGKDIINGLIDGIWSMADSVWDIVSDIASGVADAFTNMLDINSPSKVFEGFGININEGLIQGLQTSISNVNGVMSSIYGNMTDKAGQTLSNTTNNTTSEVVNNYNMTFTSPTALDPYETSRLSRNALRELSLQL